MRAATFAAVAGLATSALAIPAPFLPWGNKQHGGPPSRGGSRPGPPGPHGPPAPAGGPPAPPTPSPGQSGSGQGQCLSKEEGEEAADVFRALIQEYSDEIALEYLTEDFVDWSSSVLGIINGGGDKPKDLEAPAFNSRQEFMDGQGSQPEIPFEKIQIWTGCDFVTMRWKSSDSAAGQPNKAASIVRISINNSSFDTTLC